MSSLPSGISYTANRSDFDIHAFHDALSKSGTQNGEVVIYARKLDGVSSNTEYSLVAPKGGDNEKEKGSRVAIESFRDAMSSYWGDNKVLKNVMRTLIGVESESLYSTASSSSSSSQQAPQPLTLNSVASIIKEMQGIDWTSDIFESINTDPKRFLLVHKNELTDLTINILESGAEARIHLARAFISETQMRVLKEMVDELTRKLSQDKTRLSPADKADYLSQKRDEFDSVKMPEDLWSGHERFMSNFHDKWSNQIKLQPSLLKFLGLLHDEIKGRKESVNIEWANGGTALYNNKTAVFNLNAVVGSLDDPRLELHAEFISCGNELHRIAGSLQGFTSQLNSLQSFSAENEMARIIFMASARPNSGLAMLKGLVEYFNYIPPGVTDDDSNKPISRALTEEELGKLRLQQLYRMTIGNWIGDTMDPQDFSSTVKRMPKVPANPQPLSSGQLTQVMNDADRFLIRLNGWILTKGPDLASSRLKWI